MSAVECFSQQITARGVGMHVSERRLARPGLGGLSVLLYFQCFQTRSLLMSAAGSASSSCSAEWSLASNDCRWFHLESQSLLRPSTVHPYPLDWSTHLLMTASSQDFHDSTIDLAANRESGQFKKGFSPHGEAGPRICLKVL